ncbi:MAG: sigma-70 family RNA polymerase sigma factor [Kutzneria sp.]|nr:sigma-70 family RNA polymerase sigma factor [Kutzneria sp.]
MHHQERVTSGWPISALLRAAGQRDQAAWRELVHRYSSTVWAVARAHRLNQADAADAVQNTWLALAEKSHTIRNPAALACWLATTARREALDIIARRRREAPVDHLWAEEPDHEGPETQVVLADQYATLWRAFALLPERCQRMLRLMAHAPELSYPQIAAAVGLAPGSIGQTRNRCLALLRRRAALVGMFDDCGR